MAVKAGDDVGLHANDDPAESVVNVDITVVPPEDDENVENSSEESGEEWQTETSLSETNAALVAETVANEMSAEMRIQRLEELVRETQQSQTLLISSLPDMIRSYLPTPQVVEIQAEAPVSEASTETVVMDEEVSAAVESSPAKSRKQPGLLSKILF